MTPAAFEKTFNLPFEQAESFFLSKLNIPTQKWDDYLGEIHAKAFMSAGAYNADLLTDLRGIVNKAIKDGTPLPEFREQFKGLVKKRGWQLNSLHDNPNSPEAVAWRADLIWRTNINSAYQAGRWEQFTDGTTKHLRYKHADGVMNPRPQHVAWNNLVLPVGHDFWKTHYPPNGFGCHCRAYHVDDIDLDKWSMTEPPDGWNKIDPKTGAPKGIDKGWGYNVGVAGAKSIQDVVKGKMDKWPPDVREAYKKAINKRFGDIGLTDMPPIREFPKSKLLPKGNAPEFYVNKFLESFGTEIGTPIEWEDVTGTFVEISDKLFQNKKGEWKVLKRDREPYVLMLSETLKYPDEIWIVSTDKEGLNDRRRYVARWAIDGEEYPALVIFEDINGAWTGVTAFKPDEIQYLMQQREGIKIWRRF